MHAINGTWVPEGSIEMIQDEAEKYLFGKYNLADFAGKGRRHVPVLIPFDLIEPVKLLNSSRIIWHSRGQHLPVRHKKFQCSLFGMACCM